MLISEKGLVRAIKRAYKNSGYVVMNTGDAVVINAVRKACSGWAKEWERAVWNALEGVDLHKEEAGR